MSEPKKIAFFERYLSLWVALCIVAGVVLGNVIPGLAETVSRAEIANVNLPVAVLIWLMIYPMMVKIDFGSLRSAGGQIKGLSLTVIVNWLIKPFTMAFFAWLFFDKLYSAFLTPEEASDYIAGAILLGAAPCTAMVFVWSYLTDGDANYTLIQVSVNDLILLIAFVPIVSLLLGVNDITVPYDTLLMSVGLFVVVPLVAGYLTNQALKGRKGAFRRFEAAVKPLSITALLLTLILLFMFQGQKILDKPLHILLIAIPLLIQTYAIFGITWIAGKYLKLPFYICAPAAMIGASNFFELAVAVAIALFGLDSGAALTTVVGVLIEVPVMLSLVRIANNRRY